VCVCVFIFLLTRPTSFFTSSVFGSRIGLSKPFTPILKQKSHYYYYYYYYYVIYYLIFITQRAYLFLQQLYLEIEVPIEHIDGYDVLCLASHKKQNKGKQKCGV